MAMCVNALSRASLISTVKNKFLMKVLELCQCPKSGEPHFYGSSSVCVILIGGCVNALSRASLISTQRDGSYVEVAWCVNALSRASLISTDVMQHMNSIPQQVSMP